MTQANEIITHEGVQYRKVEREAEVGDKVVVVQAVGAYPSIRLGNVLDALAVNTSDGGIDVPVDADIEGDDRAFLYNGEYATLEPLPAAMPKLTDAKPGDRVRIVAADDCNHEGYVNGNEFTVKETWDNREGIDVIDERRGGDFELYAEEFEVVREVRAHNGDAAEEYANRLVASLIQSQNGRSRSRHCVVEPDGKVTCSPPNPGATYHVGHGVKRPPLSDAQRYVRREWLDRGLSYDSPTQKSVTAEVTQAERIEDACRDLSALLVRKNHDYGDSFAKQYEKYGLTSALIRMDDKLMRLETLNDGQTAQVAESVEDTLIDLAGYALLAAVELRKTT